MYLKRTKLFSRILDTGFRIGRLCCGTRILHVAAIPLSRPSLAPATRRQLQRLDRNQLLLSQLASDCRRCYDGASRTITDTTAIKYTEWLRDHRRIEDSLHANALSQMCLRILHAVLMALPRD